MGADADALTKIEPSLGEARNLAVDADDEGFELSVDSASGRPFRIERSGGRTLRTCGGAGEGGCPKAGTW